MSQITEFQNSMPLNSLAVVLPRAGASLGGGAETLAQSLIYEVKRASKDLKVEIWTTCAKDHRTWENFHPPGVTVENGITVRRFSVDPRNLEIFIQCELAIQEGRPLSVSEQLDWLQNSVNSRSLYEHIARYGSEFDAILFAPYLFATSFWGALIHPERSILIPCLHNENYAYLEVFQHLFNKVRGLIFNSGAEREFALELFPSIDLAGKSRVVGMGFERPKVREGKGVHPVLVGGVPYLLYSGRKERGKNLDLLIENFVNFKTEYPKEPIRLVVIGAGEIDFINPLPPDVLDLGFVTEAEKQQLMAGALAVCQPSVNESFSIVLMEAWLERTPVIVNAQCAVTREHVVKSGGGLYFANAREFSAVLRKLVSDREFARSLGEFGSRYVAEEYSWTAVLERFKKALLKFGFGSEFGIGAGREEIDEEGTFQAGALGT